jgi:DNA-binding XRE family transcriptional regulator
MRDRVGCEEMAQVLAANLLRLIGHASHQEIAEKVGISRSALYNIVQGSVDPRLSTVQALADVLCVPIGALTGEQGEDLGLTPRALEIARTFDALDPEQQALAWKLVRMICDTSPSSR